MPFQKTLALMWCGCEIASTRTRHRAIMTIAICLKVGDGIVLGADSASSLIGPGGVENVYFNAEKVFNLRKGLPIGAVTYGLGGLGGRSITSMAKDLRQRFSTEGPWHLDPKNYTMEEVARRVSDFFYDELYRKDYNLPSPSTEPEASSEDAEPPEDAGAKEQQPETKYPPMGFTIAGFSAGASHPEVWTLNIREDGRCDGPNLLYPEEVAGVITWNGAPEAIQRLVFGYSSDAFLRLLEAGLDVDPALQLLRSFVPLAHPAMPIQDAIDLVDFLANVTAGYTKFAPGPPTVAPPIDLASITLYEQFRWVRRKHFYSDELNPPLLQDQGSQ